MKEKKENEKFDLSDALTIFVAVFCVPFAVVFLILFAIIGRVLKFAIPAVVITAAVYFTWTWVNGIANNKAVNVPQVEIQEEQQIQSDIVSQEVAAGNEQLKTNEAR